MKLFKCQHCGQLLYFENTACERCSHKLGYLPEMNALSALEPEGDAWRVLAQPSRPYRFCANAAHDACNWLIPAIAPDTFCLACRHNRTVPDLVADAEPTVLAQAGSRQAPLVLYPALPKAPIETRAENPEGLAFDFLADQPAQIGPKVMTGHDNGLITIALAEADDAEREKRRTSMGEPYRTLLATSATRSAITTGIGWCVTTAGSTPAGRCSVTTARTTTRRSSGITRKERPQLAHRFISAYATVHPWEDFAETWAHYLHIVDTLEMAGAFGVHVDPKLDHGGELEASVDFDPYTAGDVSRLSTPGCR